MNSPWDADKLKSFQAEAKQNAWRGEPKFRGEAVPLDGAAGERLDS